MTTGPLTLEEAQARLLAFAEPLPIEHVDVERAIGRYLAEPLRARRTHPAVDLSAMDGYAMVSGDVAGPWQIVGESAAGHPFTGSITAGQTVRISTGAILPEGAAGIILQEDVMRTGDRVALSGDAPQPEDKHVRRRGMDFAASTEILPVGARIGSAQAALALAGGHRQLPVRRMARVTIIDSGDELSADPENCAPAHIPATNGVMLTAMARTLPVDAQRIGPVKDTLASITQALEESSDADLVVTSGGASVGDHDLIRPALERWGARMDFWRVAIKPGKPILVATREVAGRRQIILGLPGNPVSSYVTGHLFLLPLLRALSGAAQPFPLRIGTRLGAPIRAAGKRREFLRGSWNGREVIAHPLQDSGALSPLAHSNALIDRHAHATSAGIGTEVEIFLLENGGNG